MKLKVFNKLFKKPKITKRYFRLIIRNKYKKIRLKLLCYKLPRKNFKMLLKYTNKIQRIIMLKVVRFPENTVQIGLITTKISRWKKSKILRTWKKQNYTRIKNRKLIALKLMIKPKFNDKIIYKSSNIKSKTF